LRILFWGTPDFAVPSLCALDEEGFEIIGVVTQPDRPAGRGRKLTTSAIKQVALKRGFDVLTPERPATDDFLLAIRALAPDVSVVVAYGHILKPEVLEVPRLGSINVHASLLPSLRGAAPITWAITRGHAETGVTIMRMVQAMDAGAILHQLREPILPADTASELAERLSVLGAHALVDALALLSSTQATEVEQDHTAATYAPKVGRDTARVDWNRSANEVERHIRGMDAVPGAWSTLNDAPVKLFRPSVVADAVEPAAPGTVLRTQSDEGVLVATAAGSVLLAEVQPPGRRRMSASDWINGRGVAPGQRFE
jgi:methionyl-tRNA formyltransferase